MAVLMKFLFNKVFSIKIPEIYSKSWSQQHGKSFQNNIENPFQKKAETGTLF